MTSLRFSLLIRRGYGFFVGIIPVDIYVLRDFLTPTFIIIPSLLLRMR